MLKHCWPLALGIVLVGAAASRGATIEWVGTVDNNWANAANWDPAIVPGSTAVDSALIVGSADNPDVVSLVAPTNVFDVVLRAGASLDVSAGFRPIRNFDLGVTGSLTTNATVNHTAGQMRIRDLFTIGQPLGTSGQVRYTMSGSAQLLFLGGTSANGVEVRDNGTFSIVGQAATLRLADVASTTFTLVDTATLSYTLGATAASPLTIGSGMTIGPNSLLTIDASVYTAGAGTIPLATFGSRSGQFSPANVTVTGLAPGLSGSVEYTSTSMSFSVVPEPSVCGVVIGLLGVGLGRMRRRR